jgi:hypothetical protein
MAQTIGINSPADDFFYAANVSLWPLHKYVQGPRPVTGVGGLRPLAGPSAT